MFTEEQRKWIVLEYGKNPHQISLKRKFCKKYEIKGRNKKPYYPHLFMRIVNEFKNKGIAKSKRSGCPPSRKSPEAQQLIQREVDENPMKSIRQIAKKLDFGKTTTNEILRDQLKLKPYKLHRCQELSEDHKNQRSVFCNWILDNNIDPHKIIFTDEKWFLLHPHPNRQNTRIWSAQNPYQYDDCMKQGAEKVMCWAAIIEGKILPPVWFNTGTSVNSESYLALLKNNLWPAVRTVSSRRQYTYQQDGAPCHCANKCLDFLSEKFQERVISRRTDRPWPAHSPDLSPLDYWFWGEMDHVVALKKPETLEDLKRIIEETAAAMEEAQVFRAVNSLRRRVLLCVKNNGGHFEAEM